jgi:N-methylhydantoinase B
MTLLAGTLTTAGIAAAFVALKHVFHEVPTSGGCLDPVEFVIPEGSILAAEPPAPVSGYTENIMRTIDVIFGALAQAAPERANAACFATVNALLMSGNRDDGGRFILFTFFGGGLGGNPDGDGLSHGNAPIGMANIPPAEIVPELVFILVWTVALILVGRLILLRGVRRMVVQGG